MSKVNGKKAHDFFHFSHQLAIQGSSPGVRAGHAAVNVGTKASHAY